MTTAGDIYNAINRSAPFNKQESWDNSGFLVGSMDSVVTKVLMALDITRQVVEEAVKENTQLIISHHPVIFNPIKSLPAESVVYKLAGAGISAICAHSNLDIAGKGVNTVLAKRIGLTDIKPLCKVNTEYYKQIKLYIPSGHTEKVYKMMAEAGAGELGGYSGCAYVSKGEGRFIPGEESNPYIGSGAGVLEKTDEDLLSMVCSPSRLPYVIEAMLKAHPYEVPAYEISDNLAVKEENTLGLTGSVDKEYTPEQFAALVKDKLNCQAVRLYSAGRPIKNAAVCSGSGGSLIKQVIRSGCGAFITGDVKHDVALSAIDAGVTIIDAGHFETENIIMEPLAKALSAEVNDVQFIVSERSKTPVKYI